VFTLSLPFIRGTSDDGILGRDVWRDDEGEVSVSEATPMPVTKFITRDGRNMAGQIAEIAAGLAFCLFRTIAGDVFMCGSYKEEENTLFRNTLSDKESVIGYNEYPVHVPMPGNAKAVRLYADSDAQYCFAELENGKLVSWGMAHLGQVRERRYNGTVDGFFANADTARLLLI
jgi:hypothetical protein